MTNLNLNVRKNAHYTYYYGNTENYGKCFSFCLPFNLWCAVFLHLKTGNVSWKFWTSVPFVLSRFWQEWSSPQVLASTGLSAMRSADVCSLWNLPTNWTSSNDCGRGEIIGSYAVSDRETETYSLMTCVTFGVCISRRSVSSYLWPVTFLRASWCTAIFSLGPNNRTITISMPLFPLKRRC